MSVPTGRGVPVAMSDDYVRWCETQARALREGSWTAVDSEHVADELDALGRSERHRLESNLASMIAHVLAHDARPERAGHAWPLAVAEHALRIARQVEASPSLRAAWGDRLDGAYALARAEAATATELPLETFPAAISPHVRQRVDDAVVTSQGVTTLRGRRPPPAA